MTPAESLPFTDAASSWALDGIAAVYANDIMTCTSATTFDGKASYTIEQAVVILIKRPNVRQAALGEGFQHMTGNPGMQFWFIQEGRLLPTPN